MKDLERASQLMDAIGGIDDSLIWEATTYRPSRSRASFRRWMTVAASLFLTFALILLVTLGGNLIKDDIGGDASQNPATDPPSSDAPSLDNSPTSVLDELSHFAREIRQEEIPFFDGVAYLVWSPVESDTYYISRPLSEEMAEELIDEMAKGTRADGAPLEYQIWLIREDGSVITPHLIPSYGNIYYGTLFDYDAELIPSDDFTNLLSNIPI